MQQYGLSFGFREPYQVLRKSLYDQPAHCDLTSLPVDADMIRDADRFKMDLVGGLERTLHGEVKPSTLFNLDVEPQANPTVITQCSMRHLYAAASEPGVSYLIDKAKTYERRRCGHKPEDFPDPLSTEACLASVVDPKSSSTNKNRYVVASQDGEVRKKMRGILGVPLVYINRSVMIMEPMAEKSSDNREREERVKFRAGLKRGSGSLKRKREDGEEDETEAKGVLGEGEDIPKKKKKVKGPKGPNPLAMKKSKKTAEDGDVKPRKESNKDVGVEDSKVEPVEGAEPAGKTKRKRKHKSAADTSGVAIQVEPVGEEDGGVLL